ncbi:MAG: molybdenum cofactor guanylyltransferase [Candidatus Synoicihabitans palmerolidicus]|nr:molybdenum cofactor guanylyltransferase [Candidatus Synoicihabitans palmerolidicus]
MSYSALVIAGGHSRRMGQDKASLRQPQTGKSLLAHQLALLRQLSPPPDSLLVSARSEQMLPAYPAEVVRVDDRGDQGPLGGLCATLSATTCSHLLVVPVDLPEMDTTTLQALLDHCTPGHGSVARSPEGLEPLVAVYPRSSALPLASALREGRLGLQRLLQSAAMAPLFPVLHLLACKVFTNWNTLKYPSVHDDFY